MTEKFLALDQDKQERIIHAALACFARHGYKVASIGRIAADAGVSKASIFQYFGDKKTLYQDLFLYCSQQMQQAYDRQSLDMDGDFFDRVWNASVMKVENLKNHPHVSDFILSAFRDPETDAECKASIAALTAQGEKFVQAMVIHPSDREKFQHGEDVDALFQMLMLMAYGLAQRLQTTGDYDAVMDDFKVSLAVLKHNFYKEEYL